MTNISEKTTGSCKDREYIVTEVCPHCEAEVEMRWNVAATATRRSALIAASG